MEQDDRGNLFNRIAPFYGLFYNSQKRTYRRTLKDHLHTLGLPRGAAVLDVGCGTGAFCSALNEQGFKVTGIDPAERMLAIGRKRKENKNVLFIRGSILEGVAISDSSFDCVLASYVAHGFSFSERQIMYEEMKRLSKNIVLLHDFNRVRSPWVDVVERLERSDYVNFISSVEKEMSENFIKTRTIQVGSRAAWYIGEKD